MCRNWQTASTVTSCDNWFQYSSQQENVFPEPLQSLRPRVYIFKLATCRNSDFNYTIKSLRMIQKGHDPTRSRTVDYLHLCHQDSGLPPSRALGLERVQLLRSLQQQRWHDLGFWSARPKLVSPFGFWDQIQYLRLAFFCWRQCLTRQLSKQTPLPICFPKRTAWGQAVFYGWLEHSGMLLHS